MADEIQLIKMPVMQISHRTNISFDYHLGFKIHTWL